MSNNGRDQLLDNFMAIAAQGPQLTSALGETQSIATTLKDVVTQVSGVSAAATAAGGGGGSGWSTVKTVLESGLGIAPLISGLVGLFGGGDSSATQTFTKYSMPASIAFQEAAGGNGLTGFDYDQFGAPRAYGGAAAGQTGAPEDSASSGGGGSRGGPPQITVNVNAMDARSFLDRSGDIAAAVRNAMLNLNSINDVVNDL